MATPTYDLIDSQVLSTSAASVSFTSIPATYRDLVLVANTDVTVTTTALLARLNGDTGNNYSNVGMAGDGSSGSSTSNSGIAYFYWECVQDASTNFVHILQIMDYSATDKHKSVLIRGRGNTRVTAYAGRWANTAAVNSVSITANTNALAAGSTFYLYGIAS